MPCPLEAAKRPSWHRPLEPGPVNSDMHFSGLKRGGGELRVFLEGEGAATVPLVSSYKHLGAMQGPKGGLRAEIAYRTGQAAAAYNEGRRKVYRSRAIPPQRKAFILRTAVIPKLTFGCGFLASFDGRRVQEVRGMPLANVPIPPVPEA